MTTLLNQTSLLWQNQNSLWQNQNSLLWQKKYTEFCKKNNIMIKSHQIDGVIWCLRREFPSSEGSEEIKRKRGGVLADEMGMGKTIQMIGVFMLNPVKKTLLIVPPILVNQWFSEIRKFTGHVSTVYYGKDRKKIDLSDPKVMVVITSYETISRDIQSASNPFKRVQWNRVICDEAHHLRNPKTQNYSAVRAILSSSNPITWFITGTPVHHSPKDMYALYVLLGYSLAELLTKDMAILRWHFLQRKHQENDLPQKTEHTIMIEWTEAGERDLAKDIHQTIPFLGFALKEEEEAFSFWEKKKRPLLVSMIRAKQTCILSKMTETSYLSPSLSPKREDQEDKEDEDEDEDNEVPFLATFEASTTTKLQEILSILKYRRENGNGKVIFCHYRLEMAYLLNNLSNEKSWVGTWREYKKITDRSSIGESPILVLQIQSGCEGLNLQDQFSEVYFVSPDWNPTLEDQAVARCYRIGQKKPVEVFRFAMNFVDSPEENFKRKREIQQYQYIIERLPSELQEYLFTFLPNSLPFMNIKNYSMDQYTSRHSDKKKTNIEEFLESIRTYPKLK